MDYKKLIKVSLFMFQLVLNFGICFSSELLERDLVFVGDIWPKPETDDLDNPLRSGCHKCCCNDPYYYESEPKSCMQRFFNDSMGVIAYFYLDRDSEEKSLILQPMHYDSMSVYGLANREKVVIKNCCIGSACTASCCLLGETSLGLAVISLFCLGIPGYECLRYKTAMEWRVDKIRTRLARGNQDVLKNVDDLNKSYDYSPLLSLKLKKKPKPQEMV